MFRNMVKNIIFHWAASWMKQKTTSNSNFPICSVKSSLTTIKIQNMKLYFFSSSCAVSTFVIPFRLANSSSMYLTLDYDKKNYFHLTITVHHLVEDTYISASSSLALVSAENVFPRSTASSSGSLLFDENVSTYAISILYNKFTR